MIVVRRMYVWYNGFELVLGGRRGPHGVGHRGLGKPCFKTKVGAEGSEVNRWER